MRKSAKRGEPQIFLLCVTVWAWAGDVVSARAFALPVPRRHRQKIKARHLGLDTLEGVLGPSSFHSESAIRGRAAKKPSHVHNVGVSNDNPTIAVQETGTYGGQGTAAGFRGPAALLYELSLFVLAVTSRRPRTVGQRASESGPTPARRLA
jgi:hypothetical protein